MLLCKLYASIIQLHSPGTDFVKLAEILIKEYLPTFAVTTSTVSIGLLLAVEKQLNFVCTQHKFGLFELR